MEVKYHLDHDSQWARWGWVALENGNASKSPARFCQIVPGSYRRISELIWVGKGRMVLGIVLFAVKKYLPDDSNIPLSAPPSEREPYSTAHFLCPSHGSAVLLLPCREENPGDGGVGPGLYFLWPLDQLSFSILSWHSQTQNPSTPPDFSGAHKRHCTSLKINATAEDWLIRIVKLEDTFELPLFI